MDFEGLRICVESSATGAACETSCSTLSLGDLGSVAEAIAHAVTICCETWLITLPLLLDSTQSSRGRGSFPSAPFLDPCTSMAAP